MGGGPRRDATPAAALFVAGFRRKETGLRGCSFRYTSVDEIQETCKDGKPRVTGGQWRQAEKPVYSKQYQMDEYTLATALIIFVGALLQGLTGFGGALFSMPFLLLYTNPLWAAPVVVLSYTVNRIPAMFILRKNLMWAHSLLLLAAAAPGAFLGTYLLKNIEPGIIMKILGTILILFSVYKILSPGFKITFSKAWALPAGFLSGILGGAFGTDGPPVVVYAALQAWTKEQVVGMLQSFFVLANFIIIASYWYHGLLNRSVLEVSFITIPFAIAGILLGLGINKRIGQRRFEVILSSVIGLLGFILCMR
jgi:uncharacterized protein